MPCRVADDAVTFVDGEVVTVGNVPAAVVKVERVVAVHDCGRPLNPLALESQINGGILQGISYALLEDRILDTGHFQPIGRRRGRGNRGSVINTVVLMEHDPSRA